jgi:glucose-1-phosphate thymidylyltransferase
MEEGKKLGSIGALDFFIKQKAVDEDLLVVFGDNLFEADMGRFMDFYAEKGSFVFGVHDTGSIEESRKMGVVLLDGDGRVTNFEEKPEQPKSTLVSTGVYVMPKKVVGMVSQYVREGNSADRFGDFLVWLMNRHNLHAFHFDKWFDIGTPETYARANEEFAKA